MLTPLELNREYTRGRGEVVALTILGTLFFGLPVLLGISMAAFDSAWAGLAASAALAAFPIWNNQRKRAMRAATLGLNAAYRCIALGRLTQAEELLDTVGRFSRSRWSRRLNLIQRALVALRRGNLAEAKGVLDEALAIPVDGKFKANSAYQIEGAHAMRAFVCAGLGDRDAALAEVAWIRDLPSPSPEALARVALAEAILLERSGERDALRELLDRERTLLLEHTHPRERAIVRAFQRMLKVTQKSVYRVQAPPEERASGDEPELDDWVAKIAPGAAQFVRKGKKDRAQLNVTQTTYVERQQAAAQQLVAQQMASQGYYPGRTVPTFNAGTLRNTKSTSQRNGLIALGIVGIVTLLAGASWAIDYLSAPVLSVPTVGEEAPSLGLPLFALALGAAALGGAVYAGVKRAYRAKLQREQLRPAARGVARPSGGAAQAPTAQPDLFALVDGPDDVLAAQGHMLIASGAEKRGEWMVVLEHCDKAIARLWSPNERQRADILYPDLHSLRAFALACMGRYADAEAALRWLSATYPHLERAVFRVRLVELIQMGRLPEAASYAETQALELPLSVREELLADLARAVVSPETAGLGEVARLREEIDKTENAKRWVMSISPGLFAAFQHGAETDLAEIGATAGGVRVASPYADVPPPKTLEQQAEEELDAELDAAVARPHAPEGYR